ncbi:hypothetical protein [Metabacillus iocasae]|uniref:Spore coat protein B n=1 Tax=Priestia iocasae TaxID=2291674 RepID=A0ABS2QX30_9BACI|nr:hypothetical protein [Metabacillus iocasae]MBM7703306.1 spore coat protein B [Metabacillus iocasae]
MTYYLRSSNNNTSGHFYTSLRPLIGKTVKVNRGGPESKSGTLLDLKHDYLALAVEGNSHVSYYQLKHVKSVTEDSKVNADQSDSKVNTGQSDSEQKMVCVKEKSFVTLLKQLKNNMIQINQGGPESTKVFLIDVTDSYLVVFSMQNGISYFNMGQIKSVTPIEGKSPNVNSKVGYIRTSGFASLFKALMTKWVSLNVGGPEAVEGIVVQSSSNNIMLIKNMEVLRIQLVHIRSVTEGARNSFKAQQESSGEAEEAAENTSTENASEESNSAENSSQENTSAENNLSESNSIENNESNKENKDNSKEDKNSKENKDNSKEDKNSKENKDNSKEDKNSKENKGNSKEDKNSKENKDNSKEDKNSKENKGNSKEDKKSKESKDNSKEDKKSKDGKGKGDKEIDNESGQETVVKTKEYRWKG